MKETIVFVHGMSHGAWCWEESFIPYFERLGYHCLAINLPGHEMPGNTKAIHYSLDAYVEALSNAVATLENDPILIGHSMGGMILQKYLVKGRCKKAILLASVPPSGVFWPSLRVLAKHPGGIKFLFQFNLLGVFRKYTHLMFGSNIRKAEYAQKMCSESFWAYVQMMIPFRRLKKGIPMLVMGGTEDQLISVEECLQTAQQYSADLILLEGGSHDLMLDANSRSYVNKIHLWLSRVTS
jgi:pimeloyl-ACP methyl ester carboxylesterase